MYAPLHAPPCPLLPASCANRSKHCHAPPCRTAVCCVAAAGRAAMHCARHILFFALRCAACVISAPSPVSQRLSSLPPAPAHHRTRSRRGSSRQSKDEAGRGGAGAAGAAALILISYGRGLSSSALYVLSRHRLSPLCLCLIYDISSLSGLSLSSPPVSLPPIILKV